MRLHLVHKRTNLHGRRNLIASFRRWVTMQHLSILTKLLIKPNGSYVVDDGCSNIGTRPMLLKRIKNGLQINRWL